MGLVASRAVGHAILAVNIGIMGGRDLHGIDGHVVFPIARHGWAVIKVSGDALVLETTLVQEITLAERVRAAEARELVAAILAEGTWLEAAPVIATLLVRRAVVVGVAWA